MRLPYFTRPVSRFAMIGTVFLLFAEGGRAELDRLVIAHYMTDMVPRTDRPLSPWIDPELADPNGSTASLGGLHQTIPMASLHLKKADLTTAVDFEIRAALQMGVDGFQFYYPLGDNRKLLTDAYNPIVREFLRLSEQRYPGFRISLCFAHPHSDKMSLAKDKISFWSPAIRELLSDTASSPSWLRSPKGNLLFFLWAADRLADEVIHIAETPEQVRSVAQTYADLSSALQVPIQYVYQVRRPLLDEPYLEAVTKSFAAVWGWTASEENPAFWDALASSCRKNGCLYTQTVYPDYYTSKVYRRDAGNYQILPSEEAVRIGADGIERHYRVGDLSRTQIHLFEQAIRREAAVINYATWNDFPEGHHLAPEVHRNFAPSLLLRHFKQQWKSGSTRVARDEAMVFFKRYRHDRIPRFDISLNIKSSEKDLAREDHIELVTLLTAPASCLLNDQELGMAPAGLHVFRIPSVPGPVHVQLTRQGTELLSFQTPVSITEAPERTDRLTYSYSTADAREAALLFPALKEAPSSSP